MTSVIEPIMIVVLAAVVGYIVVSIVLPILQIGEFK
jgi:type II secretory pathway component PulF